MQYCQEPPCRKAKGWEAQSGDGGGNGRSLGFFSFPSAGVFTKIQYVFIPCSFSYILLESIILCNLCWTIDLNQDKVLKSVSLSNWITLSLSFPLGKCGQRTWTCVSSLMGWETSLLAQGLRLHTPNAGGLGLIPGEGTRSHMLQLKVCRLQLKIPHAAMKIEDSTCLNYSRINKQQKPTTGCSNYLWVVDINYPSSINRFYPICPLQE